MITKFLADLVNATSDCVQAISDQCLAKGLITRSTYDRVLEPGGISEDKARTLILSVQKSTRTDSSCFNTLVEILDEQLPPASKRKLLQEMKQELEDRAMSSKTLVPLHSQQSAEFNMPLTVASLQCVQQQSSLLGRYENSVSRLAYTSARKNHFEEELQSRVDKSGQLKDKLEMLENQLKSNSLVSEHEISSTKDRISACETEMGDLKRRIEELKYIIEEESMQAKRGRSTIRMETKRLFDQVVYQSQQEIRRKGEELTEILRSKEQEHQKVVSEREATVVKIRELEHKVALQEKELKIKEMELNNAKMSHEMHAQLYPLTETPPTQQVAPPESSVHFTNSGSSIPSLKNLLTELYFEVSDKWEDIGIFLDIDSDILDAIRLNYGDIRSCLREMLKIYLKRASPPPSWSAIAEAIELLGNRYIANRLRAKYCTLTHVPSTELWLETNHHGVLFSQILSCASQWREIGTYLQFTQSELDSIEASPLLRTTAPNSWLGSMLKWWLQFAPGDNRGSTNFATLQALQDALRRANLGGIALDLHL